MKILVVGYYNHENYGDDMYLMSFPKIFPRHQLQFVDIEKLKNYHEEDYDAIILGGGDVVNGYFIDKFKEWKTGVKFCCAYSIGIPYFSMVADGHLDMFDHIICRNKRDTQRLIERFGYDHVSYLPDFVFINYLPTLTLRHRFPNRRRKVSIFLAGPCLNDNVINKLARFLDKHSKEYDFEAYPFNTNPVNTKENDNKGARKLKLAFPNLVIIESPPTFQDIIRQMRDSYFCICMRLHSNILSIMSATPFVSLFSTRKVRNLLFDHQLEDLGVCLTLKCKYCKNVITPEIGYDSLFETERRMLPGCPSCQEMCATVEDLDLDMLEARLNYVTNNRTQIRERLQEIAVENREMLSRFQEPILSKSEPKSGSHQINVDKEKKKLIDEIIQYCHKNIDELSKSQTKKEPPLIKIEYLEKKTRFLEITDEVQDDYYNRDRVILTSLSLKDYLLDLAKNNGVELGPRQLIAILTHLCDLISYQISGKLHPEFRYGLIMKIRQSNYNLFESLNYLFSQQLANQTYLPEVINPYSKFNLFKVHQERLEKYHYSGWNYVVKLLGANLHNPRGILFNGFVDKTFHWEYDFNLRSGTIPYLEPWVGIIHHALDQEYSEYNCVTLFEKPAFLESLKMCRGIYTLSHYLKKWIQNKCRELGIPVLVEALSHPTISPTIKFSWRNFQRNRKKKVIQIGGWYRNSYSIYELNSNLEKYAFKGRGMGNYFKPNEFDFDQIVPNYQDQLNEKCICDAEVGCGHQEECCGRKEEAGCGYNFIDNKYLSGMVNMLKSKHDSVTVVEMVDNSLYDRLLSENIVFMNLIDCSASNTLIECIVRNTPILINRHPAVVEILGPRYPFYFRDMEEAGRKSSNMLLVRLTHFYLRNLNKNQFEGGYFIDQIKRSRIFRRIRL